jgi:serine/threonine-protein kinase RsbW
MNRLYKELKIASSMTNMTKVEKFVEEISDMYYIHNSYFGNILLTIEEAVINAIKHGNKLDEKKNVQIIFTGNRNGLIFTIEDEGEGFNSKEIPNPLETDDNNTENIGKGIFLIRSLADKVVYNPKGNQVEISFNISGINHETTLNRLNLVHQYFIKQKAEV